MNKYITLLLVLLTATGSEAQALKSALVAANEGVNIEEILTPEQWRAIDSDIMSVLKGLQMESDGNDSNSLYYFQTPITSPFCNYTGALSHSAVEGTKIKGKRLMFVESAISIRAPSSL